MLPIILQLVAAAAPELIKHFAGDKADAVADVVSKVAKTVTGAGTVEDAADAINKDPALAMQFKVSLLAHEGDMARISLERDKAYLADVQGARDAHGKNVGVFWMGVTVLAIFGITMAAVLWAVFNVMQGGVQLDAAIFAALMGLVGTVVGYLAANAQQVIGYFFGSSQGSADTRAALTAAITNFRR